MTWSAYSVDRQRWNKVLAEFGNDSKIREFEETAGVDVRGGLLERTIVFGRLRLAAMRWDVDIDVGAMKVQQFIDIDTWTVEGSRLARAVWKGASCPRLGCVGATPRGVVGGGPGGRLRTGTT